MGQRCTRIQNMIISILIKGLAHDLLRVHMSLGLKSCESNTTDQVVATHRSRSQQFTVYSFRHAINGILHGIQNRPPNAFSRL